MTSTSARAGGSRLAMTFAALPGLAVALLPKLACPFCWPALASVLTALGLGSLLRSAWLPPAAALFLAVAVGARWWRRQRTRSAAPEECVCVADPPTVRRRRAVRPANAG